MPTIVIVLCALILVVATSSGMSQTAWTSGSSEGPVFAGYTLPDGDLWTSEDFPLEVCLSDPDSIDKVYVLVLENDTWVRWLMDIRYRLNETTLVYESRLPVPVPSPGLIVNYTFRFEANDTLGNMAYTDNITTRVYRGEGPIFVHYSLPWVGNGRQECYVVVQDPDGIDTVQLHVWDTNEGSWSTQVMKSCQSWPPPPGEEYSCQYEVTAPWYEDPVLYRFRLEANDTLGNSVLSCELSRWYLEIITGPTEVSTVGGFPPLEVLAAAALIPAGIAVIVVVYVRRRP